MKNLAHLMKALGEETRLRVLGLLDHGQLCVCDLMAGLTLPQSTVSRHMAFLKKAGWVIDERKGKWVYYTLNTPQSPLHATLLAALQTHLPNLPVARQDRERLSKHLAAKTHETCAT